MAAESWAFRWSIEVGVVNGHVELRETIIGEASRAAARVLAENVVNVQSLIDQRVGRVTSFDGIRPTGFVIRLRKANSSSSLPVAPRTGLS